MLFNLYGDPDAQDFVGAVNCATKAEAEALGEKIFGGPVIAVGAEDPLPNRRPFSSPPPGFATTPNRP